MPSSDKSINWTSLITICSVAVLIGTELLGDRDRLAGRACAAHQHAQRVVGGGKRLRPVGAEHQIHSGQRHRADGRDAVDGEPNMHRPVGALLAVFARAVDRIDDPHARLVQSLGIVLLLFVEKAVVGPHRA